MNAIEATFPYPQRSAAEDFQTLSKTPRKYITSFPVDTVEELGFVTDRKHTEAIIKLYVNRVFYHNRTKKVLAVFFDIKNRSKQLVDIMFFHNIFRTNIKEKQLYTFRGPISHKEGRYVMCHPAITSRALLAIDPVYSPTMSKNASMKRNAALATTNQFFINHYREDWLPQSILEPLGWVSFIESLKFLHHPYILQGESKISRCLNTDKKLKACFDRISMDELTYYYNQHSALRKGPSNFTHQPGKGYHEFLSKWKLTESQTQALQEIIDDMQRPHRMFRLLYGEVGSGKTILAFAAALAAVDSRSQAVIIAPTQILAEQMYHKFLEQTNHQVACFLSISSAKLKTKHIELATAQVVIGTNAACNMTYENLGLIVFDEQHRFGVKQRLQLIQNQSADILFMSATPIPRTLFMTRHNFMDVSYLEGNRTNVKSYLFPVELVQKVIARIPVWLEKEKVFWVCPTVTTYRDIVGCEERYQAIRQHLQNNSTNTDNIFMVHGKLPGPELQKNLQGFMSAKTGILVSTSIIEVGINIPDSSIIIIENAERFGLSQLHQLRGRVGRSGQEGKCMFLFKNTGGKPERLDFISSNQSGRSLSEFDMNNRGVGDLKGFHQQGKANWKFVRSSKLLMELSRKIYEYNIAKNQSKFIRDLFAATSDIDVTLMS